MSRNKLISLKRIEKDIKEISNNPMTGIGIVKYENDFMKYIVNIKLLNGIYEGYCLQLLLTFSEYYPVKPPKILIFPNQEFSGTYHHHIFNDEGGFKKFCFDLLDNDFLNINEVNTGWNPSYTISSLLLQVQNFLSDPDMPEYHLPGKYLIDYLFDSMKNYQKDFIDENGKVWIHTWDNPYPPMFGIEPKKEEKEEKVMNLEINDIIKQPEKNQNEINNNIQSDINGENNKGNMVTNFFSYLGSFIPYNPLSHLNNNITEEKSSISERKNIANQTNVEPELNQDKNEIIIDEDFSNEITKAEEERKEKERIEEEKRKEEERKKEEKRLEKKKKKRRRKKKRTRKNHKN